jgi:hypothetical protein
MAPTTFRKKPVEIEAMQLPVDADGPAAMAVYQWIESFIGSTQPAGDGAGYLPESTGVTIDPADGMLVIRTLEGDMKVSLGDWVIRGVQGEFYPCKPDIFEATYDDVTAAEVTYLDGTAVQADHDGVPVLEVGPVTEEHRAAATARFFTASEHGDVVALRSVIVELGAQIEARVPAGRNKAIALTALEDVQMRGNRGLFAPEGLR